MMIIIYIVLAILIIGLFVLIGAGLISTVIQLQIEATHKGDPQSLPDPDEPIPYIITDSETH